MLDYEVTFGEFWHDLVCDSDGNLNLDSVMRELHDYKFLLDQIPSIYDEVTGGRLSKTNYPASSVIQAFNDAREDDIADAIQDWKEDNE